MARSSPFRIDLQCPQCGAPAELEETQQIIDCPFCRVRHVVQNDPQLTACIQPQTDIPESELTYIPYWRFKGMAFAFDRNRIRNRVIDTSSVALNASSLPPSLGLRSQTQTLRFATSSTRGQFLTPQVPRKQLRTRLSQQLLGQGSRHRSALIQSHVGEILSLIYAPYAVNGQGIFDGLTGRRLPGAGIDDLQNATASAPAATCSFRPCLCPHCGWDLEGETDSHVMACPGCRAMWISHRREFVPIPFSLASCSSGDTWLPFWQFGVRASSLCLGTRADLIRLANLPQAVTAREEQTRLLFRIPAFRIQPALFLRLSRQLTVFDIQTQPCEELELTGLHPATLPVKEGFQAVLPLICELAWDKQAIQSTLPGCRLRPTGTELVYLPFVRRRSELVQPELKTAFLKSALDLGREL